MEVFPMAIKLVCDYCGYICPNTGTKADFFDNKNGKIICVWCKYYTKNGTLIRKTEQEYLDAYRKSLGLPPKLVKRKSKVKKK